MSCIVLTFGVISCLCCVSLVSTNCCFPQVFLIRTVLILHKWTSIKSYSWCDRWHCGALGSSAGARPSDPLCEVWSHSESTAAGTSWRTKHRHMNQLEKTAAGPSLSPPSPECGLGFFWHSCRDPSSRAARFNTMFRNYKIKKYPV